VMLANASTHCSYASGRLPAIRLLRAVSSASNKQTRWPHTAASPAGGPREQGPRPTAASRPAPALPQVPSGLFGSPASGCGPSVARTFPDRDLPRDSDLSKAWRGRDSMTGRAWPTTGGEHQGRALRGQPHAREVRARADCRSGSTSAESSNAGDVTGLATTEQSIAGGYNSRQAAVTAAVIPNMSSRNMP
jgi:hypothetical protein